jgi:hypothetical protein
MNPEEQSDIVEIQELILRNDRLFCVNGDQNLFVFNVKSSIGGFKYLDLMTTSCLYLDEIIDAKFLNGS